MRRRAGPNHVTEKMENQQGKGENEEPLVSDLVVQTRVFATESQEMDLQGVQWGEVTQMKE